MASFQNKVVVVTGGTDGIGKALVEAFILAGAKVATCGRNHDKLYRLQTAHPGNELLVYNADVSSETDCSNFIANVVEVYGTIDILINNAGVGPDLNQDLPDEDSFEQTFAVNLNGTVFFTEQML